MLRNRQGVVLSIFSIHVGHMESNEVEVAPSTLDPCCRSFSYVCGCGSDSLNVVSWASHPLKVPWRFHSISVN